MVQALPSGPRTIIHRGGYFGRYDAASGHIVYVQDDTLFAMPFDVRRLGVTGAATRSIEGVTSDASRGSAHVALSDTGTLAYSRGRNLFDARPMAWMDRSGKLSALRDEPAEWLNPEFSPDGRRIAMDIESRGQRDIWVYDWGLDVMTRVTSEPTNEEFPIWTPDGAGSSTGPPCRRRIPRDPRSPGSAPTATAARTSSPAPRACSNRGRGIRPRMSWPTSPLHRGATTTS